MGTGKLAWASRSIHPPSMNAQRSSHSEWSRPRTHNDGCVEEQYDCEPPWEGHHREYTAAELEWMLQRVGCEDVEVEFVDYNMLQFRELSAEHCECLARIIEDPSQSDTLLATGRRRAR
jgi:hypothetical protein